MTTPAPDAARTFPCKQCGAALRFAPTVGQLACPTCGTVNDAPAFDARDEAAAREELDYLTYLRAQAGNEGEVTRQVVTCPQCGAQTQFDPNVVAAVCAFCATALVSVAARTERRIQPRAVVPFALEPKAAQELFRTWIAGRWFAPNALKKTVSAVQGVRGVYVPCWTFDAQTESQYTGERGIDRMVEETHTDSQGNTVTTTRVETDWYYTSGTVSLSFDDVLVDATNSVPDHLTGALRGWDITGMKPYSDDFVAGFTVEAYQLGLEPAFEKAKQTFDASIDSAVRQDIGGNQQRVHQIDSRYDAVTFKHLLLPVWICSYQFQGKSWQVVVNGQTGTIAGDRPWSKWKLGFLILGVSVLLFWLWVLGQQ